MLSRLFKRFRPIVCRHEFKLKDLAETGTPEPSKPTSKDFTEWLRYLSTVTAHESYTKRVKWPCHKCGKVFYAHCGLDISPHHGYIVK